MNSFTKGAASPLLSIWNLALIPGIMLLAACGSTSSPPPFTASGYVDDRGAVRIWRNDSADEVRLLTVFSPWRNGETSTGEYRWQGDKLSLIELNIYGKPHEHIRVRFDDNGELSFMQREIGDRKQQISSDSIALYRFRGEQIRQTSDILRQGRIVLRQGRWQPDGTVVTCEGQTLRPALDSIALKHIKRRQSNASLAVSVAWLEAPEGSQLLLVANEDYCHWQPTEKNF